MQRSLAAIKDLNAITPCTRTVLVLYLPSIHKKQIALLVVIETANRHNTELPHRIQMTALKTTELTVGAWLGHGQGHPLLIS